MSIIVAFGVKREYSTSGRALSPVRKMAGELDFKGVNGPARANKYGQPGPS